VRTVRLNRGKNITVTEDYRARQPAQEITLTLMTPCQVQVQKEGQLLLQTSDGAEPRPALQVLFDGGKLKLWLR